MLNALTKRVVRWSGAVFFLPLLYAWGEPPPRPPDRGQPRLVRGTVKEFTTAPKGEIDGAVLNDGTTIHWPPHMGERFKEMVNKGDRIEVTGRMETTPEGDNRFEVQKLMNLRTKVSRENDDPPPPRDRKGDRPPPPDKKGPRDRRDAPPPPREAGPADGPAKTVRGIVKEFTTAPKGEIDGAVLDDGTTIHWPPHLADRFTGIVAKGDRIEGAGRMETGPEGDTHLEIQTLRNLRTKVSRENDAPPPDGRAAPPPPPDRKAGPDRTGDVEQRLRVLEDKMDRVLAELKRLNREK